MDKPLRILNVTTVFKAAGIESFIMNMYRNIDRNKIQFDFMVMRDEREFYDDEIENLGGHKYTVFVEENNALLKVIKESKQLEAFLKTNHYDIVHIHYTTPLRALYLRTAKNAGVKVRIYHSHSAEISGKSGVKKFIYSLLRKCITKWATDYFACSQVAADWMFEKKLLQQKKEHVIYNGIDVSRFCYDPENRAKMRDELGCGDSYVIVHTGRFLEQKNHRFIIKVFEEVNNECPNTMLLLLGTGELFDEVQELAEKTELVDRIQFLGVRSDVNCVLNAADCFIMPSLYEGLPVAAVEAECMGLPCIFSENITREISLTENVKFLSLEDDVQKWAKAILDFRNESRFDCSQHVIEHGYDVKQVAADLQAFYLRAVERK